MNNMNRMKTFLLAVIALMGTAGILTSCQEEAPMINYTMSVTVTNDFSKVVEAIQNGFLKNEEAVKKLTESIDKMNTDQAGKLQAVIDVLGSMNLTLDTKLAAIEAAMKAQTLSMEGKLDLIKAAIEALPDYSTQLEAIQTAIAALPDYGAKIDALVAAIEALPDYSDKFDAVANVLEAMNAQLEAIEDWQYGIYFQISSVANAVYNLQYSVDHGNTNAADAFSAIVAMLEEIKEAIANAGGGGETPPVSNSCDLDGTTIKITSAAIDRSDYIYYDEYDIYLYLEGGGYLNIMAEKEYHDGKTIDLTKKEEKRPSYEKWYWVVQYSPTSDTRLFCAMGDPKTNYVVFQNGTLYLECLGEEDGKPVFEIRLENGKIKDDFRGDGLEHTISLSFKGSLDFGEF
ncbi:MAG: hypothetical protein IJV27_11440 [Prevotella sp.]|nr:hypothetical protein [Prevotella sp.]